MRKKRRKSLLLVRIGYRGTELDSAPKGNKTFLPAGPPIEFEHGPSGNSRPPRMTTGESFTNALTETRRVVPSLPLADPAIEADTIKRADGSLEWHGARVCRLILFFAFHHPESRPPAPICPKCEQPCAIMFGHSHRASKLKITDIPVKEVDAAPLSSIEMSVRTRNLARVWAYELLDNCENDEIMSFSTIMRLTRPARKSIAGFHWDAPPNAT